MDLSDDATDKDEQAAAYLIELGSFSTEENRLKARPSIEKAKELIQLNSSREEEVIQEPTQALENNADQEPVQAIISKKEMLLKRNLLERINITEEELEEEDQNKSDGGSEEDEPEHYAIQYDENYESQKEDKKNFADLVKTHNELELTLKKNTYEVEVSNKNFGRFEKKLFSQQSEMMSFERQINLDHQREVMEAMGLVQNQLVEIQGSMRRTDAKRLEYADSIERKIQDEENAKDDAEKKKNTITQGVAVRDRRGDSIATDTKSKRMPTNDENSRPTKGGGGRSGGDRGGRSSSSDRGGRSTGSDRGGQTDGSGRGGRGLPPFQNPLTGEGMSCEGFTYLIDL
ncbi:keratin, type I cytoskeletal 10-like [Impatiens glandulifera]|uniref:keratin, type I cytoskeletal 10-like n=1 Tax=Impatiens glandulifera TaxID=253017 RepID=UPI001FB06A47|nr:keratin, type I cytoskeletal 10-like [Impatiens glandulifera]